MTRAAKSSGKVEGEGSYTATRGYNSKLKRHVAEGNVNKLASDARRALEGPERAALSRAEKAGRKGPRALGASKR